MESLVVFYIGVPYRVCVLHRGSLQMEPLVVFYREGRLEPAVGIKLAQSPGLIHTPAHQLNSKFKDMMWEPNLKVSSSLHDHCLCLCLKLQENGKDGEVLALQVGCSVWRIFVEAWNPVNICKEICTLSHFLSTSAEFGLIVALVVWVTCIA